MAKHRYSFYVETIREIDETVNAVGVETFMRLEYGTLDHLSKEAFSREIALGKQVERQQPGALRMCARADSKQALEDFDHFQREFLSGESE